MVKHFLTDLDLTASEQSEVIDLAIAMKQNPDGYTSRLKGKTLGLIFAKSSPR